MPGPMCSETSETAVTLPYQRERRTARMVGPLPRGAPSPSSELRFAFLRFFFGLASSVT